MRVDTGGQTSVNGVAGNTAQENFRFGFHLAYPFNSQHGINASYASSKKGGAGAEFDTF